MTFNPDKLAREWLRNHQDGSLTIDRQRHDLESTPCVASLSALLRRVREEALEEAAAIGIFYVPGETQSSDADNAPTMRTAWEWGCSHAATKIGDAIRARGKE